MVLEITQYGNPVLRKKCSKIDEVNESILKLAEDMISSAAENGADYCKFQTWSENKLNEQMNFMIKNKHVFNYTNYTPFITKNNKKIWIVECVQNAK